MDDEKKPSTKRAEYKEEDLLCDASHVKMEYCSNPPQIEVQEVDVAGAFLMHNVLTPEECTQFVDLAVGLGFRPAPLRNLGQVNSTRFNMSPDIRNAERVLLDAPPQLADELNRRVQPFLPAVVQCEGHTWELVKAGEGTARAPLNSRWRFGRYPKGGFFRPHYDAGFVYSPTEKTLLTFILYLNQDFVGGETVFFPEAEEGGTREVPVAPKTGSALVFFQAGSQSPLHEGREHESSEAFKYILRSDVAYRLKQPDPTPAPAQCTIL